MPGGVNLKVNQPFNGNKQQKFAEVFVMVVENEGKGQIVRALLDTGCSKLLTLNTNQKQLHTQKQKDHVQCQTYGGEFRSNSTASVGF